MPKKYLLIAEDDSTYSNIFKTKLEAEGFKVTIVDNGTKVINELKKEQPDLIMLDLIMPEKDGFETLEEIKSNDTYKNIPVLVFSNLGQEDDINKAKKLGASDYFIKSNLSVFEMVDKVKQYTKS